MIVHHLRSTRYDVERSFAFLWFKL